MALKDIKSMNLAELEQEVKALGEKPYRAAQMYRKKRQQALRPKSKLPLNPFRIFPVFCRVDSAG